MNTTLAKRIADSALQLDTARTELARYEESGAHQQARDLRSKIISLETQMSAALAEAREADTK